mmetsp:Transcript_57018/g.184658  ORF Transcript_57018/g.184658 Transcript_57018/m.184658 type:complete len:250 (+) Transcript_57018:97-846(+)
MEFMYCAVSVLRLQRDGLSEAGTDLMYDRASLSPVAVETTPCGKVRTRAPIMMMMMMILPLITSASTLTNRRVCATTSDSTEVNSFMAAEPWLQLRPVARRPADQRSRQKHQKESEHWMEGDCKNEQKFENLGPRRAKSGRSRSEEELMRFLENRRSGAAPDRLAARSRCRAAAKDFEETDEFSEYADVSHLELPVENEQKLLESDCVDVIEGGAPNETYWQVFGQNEQYLKMKTERTTEAEKVGEECI